jgi:threonine dehydrogenase-like Zn-dependent dehydrogenase
VKTKRLIFTQPGEYVIEEITLPMLKEDEVLVKVEFCGLCTWERHIFAGQELATFPFIGGHEISGVVVAKGENVSDNILIGSKAAIAKWTRCNQCYECRRGYDNQCQEAMKPIPEGADWGPAGFGEYLIAKAYEIYPLKENIDIKLGALGEPLACVIRSIKRAHIETGQTAVVIGAGLMGLLFLKCLKARGIKVIVVQRSQYRRDLAKKMKADLVIDPENQNWIEAVNSYTEGRGANAVFYTAGGGQVLNECLKATGIGGTILMYAPLHHTQPVLEADEIHYRELAVIGSIRHDKESFREAVELINDDLIQLDDLNLEIGNFTNFSDEIKRADANREIHRILLKW